MRVPDISPVNVGEYARNVHDGHTTNSTQTMMMDEGSLSSPGLSGLSGLSFFMFPFAKVGFGILAIFAIAGLIALATWQGDDPSLTVANGGIVKNWMGFWGASFADITMQFFGLSAVIPLFIILFWGVLGWCHRCLPPPMYRIISAIPAIALFAAGASCIFVPSTWSLPVGLGGVSGDAIIGIIMSLTGIKIEGWNVFLFIPILFSLGFVLFIYTSGLLYGIPEKRVPDPIWNDEVAPEFPQYDLSDYEENSLEQNVRDLWSIPVTILGLFLHIILWVTSRVRRGSRKRNFIQPFPIDMEPSMESLRSSPDFPLSDLGGGPEGFNPGFDSGFDSGFDTIVPHTDSDIPLTEQSSLVSRKRVRKPVKKTASLPLFEQGKKFALPTLDMLADAAPRIVDASLSESALQEKARLLEGVLDDFGIKGQIIQVRPGPVVTMYELEPAPGIKSSRIIGLADDIARSMSSVSARVAVVPGRNAIGIELPNEKRETVYLREQLASSEFKNSKAKLPMCLGKTIGGEAVVADMSRMPHLLVAGTTGSGKSVAINTMILSLLYRHSPDTCKLIMIDPKMLELSIYDGIPHLLTPVVTEPKKAVVALKWCVREMEERYRKMSKLGVRNIEGYNSRIHEAKRKGESLKRTVQTGFDHETGNAIFEAEELVLSSMPFLVVVIDEMADLMMVAGKDIEGTVQRLAQMARAAGIHVIMATQRPSVDVITGTIKANFPTRISFQVTSKIDSRTILGEMGAEQLLGMGDMLYMAGGGRITRVHGPFVDDKEVEDVVNHLKSQGVPQYLESVTEEKDEDVEDSVPLSDMVSNARAAGAAGSASSAGAAGSDPYDQAVSIVLNDRKCSISYVQRRLSIGYNKAASLIERMEQEGIISSPSHSGKREILVPDSEERIG